MTTKNSENMPLISIKDLTRRYPDSNKALFQKLNFDLSKWDFTVVIGKSGVGKSTLVKFIIWELRPFKKAVYYKNDDMAYFTDEEVQTYRRKIWIVFQDYKLISTLSVKENIVYPLRLEEQDEATIESKYKTIIKKLHLEEVEKIKCSALSWWEKQKVAIARAMINNPDFIIADEPTWNLDWEITQEIGDMLINANNMWNTILLITHDIHLLEYIKSKMNIKTFQM